MSGWPTWWGDLLTDTPLQRVHAAVRLDGTPTADARRAHAAFDALDIDDVTLTPRVQLLWKHITGWTKPTVIPYNEATRALWMVELFDDDDHAVNEIVLTRRRRRRFADPDHAPDGRWVYSDGGRHAAGFRGQAYDCVTRAISIAVGVAYGDVHGALQHAKRIAEMRGLAAASNPRLGVGRRIYEPYLANLGWSWTPTLLVGSAPRRRLAADELPAGRLVCVIRWHACAVVDGVVHDTLNPGIGKAIVYGYYSNIASEANSEAVTPA